MRNQLELLWMMLECGKTLPIVKERERKNDAEWSNVRRSTKVKTQKWVQFRNRMIGND
ncbi:hypothetical protein KIN20_005033 [Parelaphostrongylus tenuis]|uniref:Uncharacterized protein n=1 Tax=Parelaphostrongylus tenuis TaxID=148309 RepID=A0AAD5MKR6_PARTN|nr:hypothetical protein KIN20_005033 [Parelaphostrongylus tenuis]